MQEGYKEIGQKSLLTEEEERSLIEKIKNGDELAKKKMIESNQGLVYSIAKQFKIRCNSRISFEDLMQEGCYGLMIAILKFDLKRKCRFSTYATYWIRFFIEKAIAEQSRVVKINKKLDYYLGLYKKTIEKLSNTLKRMPTLEEISKETGYKVEKVMYLNMLIQESISLNMSVTNKKNKETVEYMEFIPSETKTPEEIMIEEETKKEYAELFDMGGLSDREKIIVLNKYKLKNEKASQRKLGNIYNVSQKRISQIAINAEDKIKKRAHNKYYEYMYDKKM